MKTATTSITQTAGKFLLSLLTLLALANVAAAAEMSADEKEIRALFQTVTDGYRQRDPDAAMSPYMKDDRLVLFDIPPPRKVTGYAGSLRSTKDYMASTEGPLVAEYSDVHVKADKKYAYAHSLMRLAGTFKGGKKFEFLIRVSDGLEKINGKWLIVHEHSSLPVDLRTNTAVLDAPATGASGDYELGPK